MHWSGFGGLIEGYLGLGLVILFLKPVHYYVSCISEVSCIDGWFQPRMGDSVVIYTPTLDDTLRHSRPGNNGACRTLRMGRG